jgi:hypothetical protein
MGALRRQRPISSGGVRLTGSIGVDLDAGLVVERKPERAVYSGKDSVARSLRGGSGTVVVRNRPSSAAATTGTAKPTRAQSAPPQLSVSGASAVPPAPRGQWA